MPLLDKLLKGRGPTSRETLAPEPHRNFLFCLGSDRIRILLFRECEWRGRKLLFDSLTLEKQQRCGSSHRKSGESVSFAGTRDFEKERIAEDDVSLLSEMVFGTVAMTYRGSSFKIHSMSSPPCIMCTKIFPATEHNACKQSGRVSDEGLGGSVNFGSNSSIRTLLSRPSSGNLSGSDLASGPRKSSTCSSTGSGWDIEIPPVSSSQSLESSGSSGFGSLSSLRRRWFRVVSTSLGKSDSDDALGMQQWPENGSCSSDNGRDTHGKRHKTRLGLTMLIRFAEGHERTTEARLLEHMALLEGMLDRIRFACIEAINVNGQTNSKTTFLSERLHRSSSRFIVSLLRLLMDMDGVALAGERSPLLWHDVLLNSVSIEEKTCTLHRSLQQMCQLLDELDTKSTNFFLSTVVTAVLTYHLGWIYTALPLHDRQTMEEMGNWYPCNPLWAQLGDLHGALGNPAKLAHTIVAGEPRKSELINAVLSFLSYFIRSGLVRKRREARSAKDHDLQDAAAALEQARAKRPYLFSAKVRAAVDAASSSSRARDGRSSRRKIGVSQARSFEREIAGDEMRGPSDTMDRPGGRERAASPLKRTATMKANLDSLLLKPTELHAKLSAPELPARPAVNEREEQCRAEEKDWSSSKVKIIVSESKEEEIKERRDKPSDRLEMKLDAATESMSDAKLDRHQRKDDHYDTLKVYSEADGLERFEDKDPQVMFTLGDEEKSAKTFSRPRLGYNCRCAFSRVPSASGQLPESVLRKIIQRNFPQSSKSIQPPPGAASTAATVGAVGFCEKCNGLGFVNSFNYDGGGKRLLETPTNATEVLRTCGSGVSDAAGVRLARSNSLEALMEANGVVELPMPRSKKFEKGDTRGETGFTKTLLQTRMTRDAEASNPFLDAGYTWGLVLQGVVKKKRRRKRPAADVDSKQRNQVPEVDKDWWHPMREECFAGARFPIIDQPVAEALCILADLDTWHVGILSNNTPSHCPPLPVGMSRLVSNMLEAFSYVWRKYHSPLHCIGILEAKLREMWMRSEALAEMLMAVEICEASVANVTSALDLEAADIPLLLAVATAHTPEIAHRFGLTLA